MDHLWAPHRIRWFCQFIMVGLLSFGGTGHAVAQAAPLWDKLPPGPYAVGFKSGWQLDYTRRYNMTFDDKTTYATGPAPRPILVNVWYPAAKADAAARMPHRDYLHIRSSDPALAKFAAKLAEYNRSVIAQEVMGTPLAKLTGKQQALLDQFLDTPTACLRDAAPAPGQFPVVIYHAGAGSSFEDNAVCCEFLASHGFIVLGSAFQDHTGKSFNTDNREGSARDLQFLIAHARQIPGANWSRIGVMGHSAGAQAALLYRSQPGAVADAVVSLDTTQDYRGVSDPSWSFTAPVARNADHFNCPLLMAAGPQAFFELADMLKPSRRYYLTLPDMDHNDYIAQGVISRERRHQLLLADPNQTTDARVKDAAALARARAGYQALCLYILRFLEAELKEDAAAKDFLARQHRDARPGASEPCVEHVPAGRTGPDPYPEDSPLPPTPRQLRPFLRTHGTAKLIAVLRRFRPTTTAAPIFERNFALGLVSDLLDQGKTQDALAIRDYCRETGLDCDKVFLQIGKGFHGAGITRPAAAYYRRALLLDPANAEAAAKLKELEEGKTTGKSP